MKLMRLMRKCKGSISIFLCLILLPMVTYATLIIDASRLQSARVAVATAGDLTMNAALSEYEQVLEDMYGIFAVAQNENQLKDSLKAYYKQTIESSLIGSEAEDEYVQQLVDEVVEMIFSEDGFDYDNFLEMKLGDFTYEPVAGTAVANPAIMKRQIIDYMKYKGPVSVVSTLMPKLDFLKDSSKQTDVVAKKVEYTEKLNSLNDPCTKAYNAIIGDLVNGGPARDGYNSQASYYNTLIRGSTTSISAVLASVRSNLTLMSECDLMYKNSYFSVSANKLSLDSLWNASGGQADIDSVYDPETKLDEEDIDGLKNLLSDISLSYNDLVALDHNLIGGNFSTNIDTVDINRNVLGQDESELDYTYTATIIQNSANEYPSLANIGSDGSWIKTLNTTSSIDDLKVRYDFQQKRAANLDKLEDFAKWYKQTQELRNLYDKVFAAYKKEFLKEKVDIYNVDDYSDDEINDKLKTFFEDDANKTYKDEYIDRLNNKKMIDAVAEAIVSKNYSGYFTSFLSKLNDCNVYFNRAGSYCNNAKNALNSYYSTLVKARDKLKALQSALEEVQNTLVEMNKTKGEWQDCIDSLGSKSSTSASMQSDLDSTTESFNKDDVAALQGVASELLTKVESLISQLESVKYLDISVVSTSSYHNNYLSSSYYDQYIFSDKSDSGNTAGHAADQADLMISRYFVNGVTESDFAAIELIDGKKSNGEISDEERFFPILKSICEPEQGQQLSEADQTNYNNTKEFSKVDDEGLPTQKTEDSTPPTSSGSSGQGEQQTKTSENFGDILKKITEYPTTAIEEQPGDGVNGEYKVSTPKMDDNGKVDGSPSNSLKTASSLLSKLSNIGTTVRDKVYLEEYFTEMFTCQTDTNPDADELILLSGYTNADEGNRIINKNTEWYGSEIEYILWGDPDLSKDRKNTETLIFTIRFALNAVYAFTASDIQTFAFQAASALVGWTVVGVPIVQACITIGIALAESALDLQALKDGQDVPIYKNSSTFQCSPGGVLQNVANQAVKEVAQYVGEKVDEEIDKIANKAYETIGDAMDDITGYVNDFVDKQAEGVKSAIEQQFVTPVINSVTPLLAKVQTGASNANDLVNEAVETTFKSIEENINAINDGPTKELILQFYERFKDEIKSQLVGKIQEFLSKVSSGADSETLRKEIIKVIDDKIGEFQGTINAKMDEYKNSIMQKVRDAGDKPIGDLKNFLHETMDDFADDISGKISDTISDSVSKQLDTGSASNRFTLNYKEYCKIFILINLVGNETEMLQRAGVLMQANVRHAVNGANPDFQLINANTMVSVSADVKLGTLMPWTVSGEENETTGDSDLKLDFSHLGDNSVTIHYNGLFGY